MKDSAVDVVLTIWTIGHSTHSLEECTRLLAQVAIGLLVDIRLIPRSRTNPQFNRETLPTALAATGSGYRHLPELGGLRELHKDRGPSRNILWWSGAFRNCADYAATNPAFGLGLGELQALARDHRIAIMCAEAVWWRCHRRIVSDYLLVAGVTSAISLAAAGSTRRA